MAVYPIIGMSPGNSYFKDDEIRHLLTTVIGRYGKTAIFIADIPSISTYVALGYPENRARRDKALPQGNNLKNRTRKIMAELGYTADQVRIVEWESEVQYNTEYNKLFTKVRSLYETNTAFEKEADETTKGVLVHSHKVIQDIDVAAKIAVHYLLSEIAFLEFAPSFFDVETVAYVYHKNWPVYEDYIAGKFDGVVRPYMDFILMENPHETFNPMWAMEESDYTVETLVNIAKTKTLRAAFSQYFPAFMYNQKDNQYAGIFFDVITKIATTHGWEIRWTEEVGYGVIVDGLCSNRFDIFASTVWPTPEREKDADFSVSLYESRVDVWCKEGSSLDTLSPSLRIAVREGDISDSIATDFLGARLVRVPQLSAPDALLQFVAEGRADITFVEQSLADRFNKDSTIKVSKASTVPIRTYGNTFMLRKGDDAFKHLLDTEIQKLLDDGFIKGLLQKYSSV